MLCSFYLAFIFSFLYPVYLLKKSFVSRETLSNRVNISKEKLNCQVIQLFNAYRNALKNKNYFLENDEKTPYSIFFLNNVMRFLRTRTGKNIVFFFFLFFWGRGWGGVGVRNSRAFICPYSLRTWIS